jgi:hypothetical protein
MIQNEKDFNEKLNKIYNNSFNRDVAEKRVALCHKIKNYVVNRFIELNDKFKKELNITHLYYDSYPEEAYGYAITFRFFDEIASKTYVFEIRLENVILEGIIIYIVEEAKELSFFESLSFVEK